MYCFSETVQLSSCVSPALYMRFGSRHLLSDSHITHALLLTVHSVAAKRTVSFYPNYHCYVDALVDVCIIITNSEQLLAMDILVLATMKNAAKCDM